MAVPPRAGGVVGLVLFDRGRSVPRPDAGLWLGLLGRALWAETGARVSVTGYANLRESARGAELLGLRRATAVASVLKALGARAEQIEVGSGGARAPALSHSGKVEPSLGRRVVVRWIAGPAARSGRRSGSKGRHRAVPR
jgi:outer membrane protein OmpA-like peptidoglycan-associated protein